MIAGVGNDIVDMRRLQKVLVRHPQRLPRRLLTAAERREFAARAFALSYLAGRLAAKEALAKALRIGLRTPLGWQRMSVLADGNGAPAFAFAPPLKQYLETRKIAACHLSLAHDGDYAVAVVVAEGH